MDHIYSEPLDQSKLYYFIMHHLHQIFPFLFLSDNPFISKFPRFWQASTSSNDTPQFSSIPRRSYS